MNKFFLIFVIFFSPFLWASNSSITANDNSPLRHPSFINSINYTPDDSIAKIPATIKSIPDFAFFDCKALKRVEFLPGSRCKSIGEYAFAGCDSLHSINLPSGITVINTGTFRECGALKSMDLPQSVVDIKSFAFIYCESLEQINLPPRLRHIGLNAFCRSGLRSIYIPDSVTEIESYAFADSPLLRSARLPANHHLLGELIFNYCDALEELTAPSTVPPRFDCNSYIFSPLDTAAYQRCKLILKPKSETDYRNAQGWSLFFQ